MPANKVFAIAGAKGGVGKTTTSLNLAASLSADGFSVVAVEMDLPMPNFANFLEIDCDPAADATLHEVLTGTAPIEDAIYETVGEFSVVPSRTGIEAYGETSLADLSRIIDTLRWRFDIILLDTPAGLSDETIRSMDVADETLIISTPRMASLQNADNTVALATRRDADVRGFILNKSGTGASPGVDIIAESFDAQLLGHVPEDEAVPHSQDHGHPVVTHSPNSGAAIAYQRLASDLVDNDRSTHETDRGDAKPAGEQSVSREEPQESLYRGGPPSTDEAERPTGSHESSGPATGDSEDGAPDGNHGATGTPAERGGQETGTDNASEADERAATEDSSEQEHAEGTGAIEPEVTRRNTDAGFVDKILSLFGM